MQINLSWLSTPFLRSSLLALLLSAATSLFVHAADIKEVPDDDSVASAESIEQLITQLGASRYAARERATNKLTAMGPLVLEAIQANLKHEDLEVRVRARRIYVQVKRVARLDLLQAFVTHAELGEHPDSKQLPGWTALRTAVGDSPESRNLLVAVLRDHWDTIESFETRESGHTEMASRHIRNLRDVTRKRRDLLTLQNMTLALLMEHDPRSEVQATEMTSLIGLLTQMSSSKSSQSTIGVDPWKHQPFRDLVSGTLARGAVASGQTFSLALQHDLKAGIEPALVAINDRTIRPYIRQYALLTVAKFGTEEHIDKIKEVMDDTGVCYKREDPRSKKLQFECQVRDVAFATLIHLSSKDPRQFGFANAKPQAFTVYPASTLGFASEEQRQLAHQKWELESGDELPEVAVPLPTPGSEPDKKEAQPRRLPPQDGLDDLFG